VVLCVVENFIVLSIVFQQVRIIKGLQRGPSIDSEADASSTRSDESKHSSNGQDKFSLFPKTPASAPKTFNRAGPMLLQRRDKVCTTRVRETLVLNVP
jgi:hypothetical protein